MKKHILFTLLIVSTLIVFGQRKHWINGNGFKCKKKYAKKYYTIIKEKSTSLFLKQYYLFDNNHLIESTHYVTKKSINKEGKHITYYNNERIKESGNYKNNLKTGEWKSYYKNEKTQSITNYYNGIKNGAYIYYYENNRVVTGSYKNDLKDSLWQIKNLEGSIVQKTFYTNGEKEGKELFYYENGNYKAINSYKKGKLYQTKKYNDEGIELIEEQIDITILEVEPQFPGGELELTNYINKNIIYPKYAIDNGIQGRGLIQFTVEKDGNITNVKSAYPPGFKREIHRSLLKEAIRVIETMPNWIPGEIKGKAVKSTYRMPVTFKIH